MESQIKEISQYLRTGKSLTPLEALHLFGCFRLAARVFELRSRGMNIKTTMVEANDKRFASYRLV